MGSHGRELEEWETEIPIQVLLYLTPNLPELFPNRNWLKVTYNPLNLNLLGTSVCAGYVNSCITCLMIQGFDHFNLEQIACWRQEGLNPRLCFCTLSHPQKWLISALAQRQAWLFWLRKKKKNRCLGALRETEMGWYWQRVSSTASSHKEGDGLASLSRWEYRSPPPLWCPSRALCRKGCLKSWGSNTGCRDAHL